MSQARVDQRLSPRAQQVGLDISVRTGSGDGQTLLSAFDRALQLAGVADFNLITLSSVIPTGSRIRSVDAPLPGGHGDLLFCVRAEAFADQPGEVAWAGLGWCVDDTGGGLFVEHHGDSEQSVADQIELSLSDMNRHRGGGYGPVQMTLASARCTDLPVCALVLAAYRVSSWHDPSQDTSEPETSSRQVPVPVPDPVPSAWAAATHGSVPRRAHDFATTRSHNDEVAPAISRAAVVTPVQSLDSLRVTVEKEVDYATARRYYDLYRQTFGELETTAAGRQLLHEDEFLEEMHDPRVDKYVAWDEDDVAIAMTTLTKDLSTVPWISPGYFAHHYPDHYARDAIYYLGFTLVHPAYRGVHVFHLMVKAMAERVLGGDTVVAWDMCSVNDERGLGGSAGRLLSTLADVTITQIDRQNYYAAVFQGPLQTST